MGWSLHRKPGLTFHNPAYSFKGYTIATPIGGDIVFLLDMAGRVVHRWRFADVRPEYAYLTERGTLLYRSLPPPDAGFRFKPAQEDDPPMPLEERARVLPSNYRFLTEADWEGETLWRHEDPLLHHDFWLPSRTPSWSAASSRWTRRCPTACAGRAGRARAITRC